MKTSADIFVIFLVLLFMHTCEAPRNNPIDPLNPKNKNTSINGWVQTLSVPHQPIQNAEVVWQNEKTAALTESDGSFEIDHLTAEDGWMHFSMQGYQPDSVFISWDGRKEIEHEQYLNALPVLDSLIFASSIINRTPNIQILELAARTQITDADNDIDTVFFVNDYLDFSAVLVYNSDNDFYERNHISMTDLGIASPEDVIGRTFKLLVKDKYGSLITVKQAQISRIIEEEIELVSPSGYEIVSSTPALLWKPFAPGFSFQIKTEIFNRDAPELAVWQKDGISASVNLVHVDQELPPGTYFWTAWAVDEFQNRCRSKAKNFRVE